MMGYWETHHGGFPDGCAPSSCIWRANRIQALSHPSSGVLELHMWVEVKPVSIVPTPNRSVLSLMSATRRAMSGGRLCKPRLLLRPWRDWPAGGLAVRVAARVEREFMYRLLDFPMEPLGQLLGVVCQEFENRCGHMLRMNGGQGATKCGWLCCCESDEEMESKSEDDVGFRPVLPGAFQIRFNIVAGRARLDR